MNILIITDNEFLYNNFCKILVKHELNNNHCFEFRYSINNKFFIEKYSNNNEFQSINLKNNIELEYVVSTFKLVISLHCKQLFPNVLVNKIRCINIHPGFNPYNRGWYPQVFSIINKKPLGATIHEMDEELDHGDIIVQEYVNIESWDTSGSIYQKLLVTEVNLLDKHILRIIDNDYNVQMPVEEGNVNYIKDYVNLCEIKLDAVATYGEVIDRLRALSHDGFNNAYFYDKFNNKVHIELRCLHVDDAQ